MITIPGEEVAACYVGVYVDPSKIGSGMAAAKSEAMSGADSIAAGIRSSLSKGDYKGVGQKLGSDLVQGMSSQFGLLGNMAGGLATAIGPVGVAALGIGAAVGVAALGLQSCVTSAADWQAQMVEVKKVLGDISNEEFQTLSDDLMDIRARTGAATESITGAAAGAGRMGIPKEEISDYTETILQMESAWGVSADAASSAIGKIGSVVKPAEMSWTAFAQSTGSAINDLADSMATSESAIVTGVSKLGASMAMLKPDEDQISSWYALVAQLQAFGMTAETSGESVKDAINYMMRDTGDISGLLDMDTEEFQAALRDDTIGVIQELAVAISELPVEEQGAALALFGATGGQAIGMLTGKVDSITGEIEGLSDAIDTANSSWESGSSLSDAYTQSQQTLSAQLGILGGNVDVVKMKIGEALLPAITSVVAGVNEAIPSIVNFGQSLYDLGGWAASIISPLGSVLETVTMIGPALDVAGSAAGFVGDLTSDLSSMATGDINIGGEWFGSSEDLKAARDAGTLTGDEYINGIREVVQSKSDVSGIDTSRMMSNVQGFAEAGLLDEDQYTSALESIAEIYEEVGDAAYEMADPITEAFETGTLSAEDYITILEDMADVTTGLGDGSEDAIEPLTKAFEDGSITVDEYKSTLDTLSQTTAALGADFDSIAGPIQDAFTNGELSVEQYQDALSTVTQAHEQLGASTQSVLSPLSEMFASGEISADEYISSMDAVLAGVDSWGPEFNRRMADLNANAGSLSAEEYMDAFDGIISDLNIDIEKSLEDVDAEGAGEKSGKSFGDEFLKGFKDAKISEELAGFVSAGFSNTAALASYNFQNSTLFKRTGEVGLGSLGTGTVTKEYGGNLNWKFSVNGNIIHSSSNYTELLDIIGKDNPAIRALINPREFEAAIAEARGDYDTGIKIRAEIIMDAEWAKENVALMDQLAEARKTALDEQEAAWLADKDAFQEMMDGLSESYHDAFEDAMGEGVIIDWTTAWEDAGKMASDAFSDNLITGIEAQDVAGALEDLKILDPAAFEVVGGEAGLAAWNGLVDALEARADYLASLPVGVEADPEMLRQFQDDINAAKEAIEPVEISANLKVLGIFDLPVGGDIVAEMDKLGVYDRKLFAQTQLLDPLTESLNNVVDNGVLPLSRAYAESAGIYDEHNSLVIDQIEAYEYLESAINVAQTTQGVFSAGLDELLTGFDLSSASANDYGEVLKALGVELSNVGRATRDLAAEYEKENPLMSWFGYWQENTEGLFPGESGYIGPGGTGAYAEFDTLRDMSQKAQNIEFAITAQGIDPDSPEAAALLADYNETRELAVALNIEIPADQAWIEQLFGEENVTGKAALGETESQNFFTYGVELETGTAEADLEKLRKEAETKKVTPVDADISKALYQNSLLEIELMRPVTKNVYINPVYGSGWGSGSWSADSFLNSTSSSSSVSSGSLQSRYSNITWLDEGGIATQPIPAIVGERRPEAIAPLEVLMPMIQSAVAAVGGSGGGNTYNITVNEAVNAQETARQVAEAVEEYDRRNSQSYWGRSR